MLLLLPTALEAHGLLQGAKPSDEIPVEGWIGGRPVQAALCGFGPVAAGVLAALAMVRSGERQVVLAGLGGTFDEDALPVGSVLRATHVAMADIGRGRGEHFADPEALGFPVAPALRGGEPVGSVLTLEEAAVPTDRVQDGLLLTVPAASASPEEVAERRARWPAAAAEDMEGYAVALAAARVGARLTILRGIANVVGASRETWEPEEAFRALEAAIGLLPA